MKLGKIIRKPVKQLRRKLRTPIERETCLSKEDLYKDVDATSIASEEFSVVPSEEFSVASSPNTNDVAVTKDCDLLLQAEKLEVLVDCGYEDVISRSDRCLSYSERGVRTPRRSSLKSSGSTSRRRSSISYRGEIDVVLPNGEEVKRRTSISFEENENQTKEVKPILNMVDNPNQIWFQKEDYATIKQDIDLLLKNNSQNEENSFKKSAKEESTTSESIASELQVSECTRGLEPLLDESMQEARIQANTSVLEEYSMQRNRGEYNEDILRQIYSFYTIDSHVEATHRADLDQQEIQNYLKGTKDT